MQPRTGQGHLDALENVAHPRIGLVTVVKGEDRAIRQWDQLRRKRRRQLSDHPERFARTQNGLNDV